MSAQVAADLRAAADVLDRDGWIRGRLGTADGPKCAIGSIYYIGTGGAEFDDWQYVRSEADRAEAACDFLAAQIGVARVLVPDWNDKPGRTAAEVISALRAAADKADES